MTHEYDTEIHWRRGQELNPYTKLWIRSKASFKQRYTKEADNDPFSSTECNSKRDTRSIKEQACIRSMRESWVRKQYCGHWVETLQVSLNNCSSFKQWKIKFKTQLNFSSGKADKAGKLKVVHWKQKPKKKKKKLYSVSPQNVAVTTDLHIKA